jgi:hypothetical protein
MRHEGDTVDIVTYNSSVNYGYLPTVTWDVVDTGFSDWLDEGSDVTFDVTISNMVVDGVTVSHSYSVTLAGPWAGEEARGTFSDDDGSVFESDIEWMAAEGITSGCNPSQGNTQFCPDDPVTRGQMAAFLVRALDLTDDGGGNTFIDDNGSVFESDIAKLAAADITRGCNPSQGNTQFCPNDPVTRGQMAAFLHRALTS